MHTLKYAVSSESGIHTDKSKSLFAKANYPNFSIFSRYLESVNPDDSLPTTGLPTRMRFTIPKSEALLAGLVWNFTLPALTDGGSAPAGPNYLRWRRDLPYQVISEMRLLQDNEEVFRVDGQFLKLKTEALRDKDRIPKAEVLDLGESERDILSRGTCKVRMSLCLPCFDDRGQYIPLNAISGPVRLEIRLRDASAWYETNIASPTVNAFSMSSVTLEQETITPTSAELSSYLEKRGWMVPHMSMQESANVPFNATTRLDMDINFKGVTTGFFVGIRNSGKVSAEDYLNFDRVPDGTTVTLLINNAPVSITAIDANLFYEYFKNEYLPQVARDDDRVPTNAMWIPFCYYPELVEGNGFLDLNTVGAIKVRLEFPTSQSGEWSIYSFNRNTHGVVNGKLHKKYA